MSVLAFGKKMIGNKQVHNFAFLSFIQASNILVSLLSVPLIVSAIGLEELGAIDSSLSIIYILSLLVVYGYNYSGPREVALSKESKTTLSGILLTVFVSKVFIAIALTLAIFLFVFLGGVSAKEGYILIFSCLILFSEAIFPMWFLQGLEKMKLVSIGNLISKLLYLALLVMLVKRPEDSYLVNFFLGGSGLIINMLMLVFIIKYWKLPVSLPSVGSITKSIKDNFTYFLSTAGGYISINSGLVILTFFADDYTLGAYSLGDRVVKVLRIVPTLIVQSIYQRASLLFANDKAVFYLFLRKAQVTATAVSSAVSLATFLAAPYVIFYFSGSYIDESILILKTLAFIPFLASLNIANVIIVLVSDRRSLLVHGTWISFLVMLAICVSLTFAYSSIGLAAGLLISEVAIFTIQFVLNYQNLNEETCRFYGISFGRRHIS